MRARAWYRTCARGAAMHPSTLAARAESRDTYAWRRQPAGAEPLPDGRGVHFRVWAPERARVDVVIEPDARVVVPLARDDDGYWSGVVDEAGAGTRYKLRLDGGDAFPDPVSRSLP